VIFGSPLQLLTNEVCLAERWCQFPNDRLNSFIYLIQSNPTILDQLNKNRSKMLSLILSSPYYPSILPISGDVHFGERSVGNCSRSSSNRDQSQDDQEVVKLQEMTSSGY